MSHHIINTEDIKLVIDANAIIPSNISPKCISDPQCQLTHNKQEYQDLNLFTPPSPECT